MDAPDGTIAVCIADPQEIVRIGLRGIIERTSDMAVSCEAATESDALRALQTRPVDVAVLSPALLGATWPQRLRQLRDQVSARILVYSDIDDVEAQRLAQAAGATGYVIRAAPISELIHGIRAVHAGRLFVDVTAPPLGAPEVAAPTAAVPLTGREIEVLRLLAKGHQYRTIARKLDLSARTVETYRARISSKIGSTDRASLVAYALREGLLQD